MNSFKASIQIEDANLRDYEILDKEMEAASFKAQQERLSLSDNGREYDYRGKGSLVEVTAATHQAAQRSGKMYSFTVSRDKLITA
jgi:hypothetical protein